MIGHAKKGIDAVRSLNRTFKSTPASESDSEFRMSTSVLQHERTVPAVSVAASCLHRDTQRGKTCRGLLSGWCDIDCQCASIDHPSRWCATFCYCYESSFSQFLSMRASGSMSNLVNCRVRAIAMLATVISIRHYQWAGYSAALPGAQWSLVLKIRDRFNAPCSLPEVHHTVLTFKFDPLATHLASRCPPLSERIWRGASTLS